MHGYWREHDIDLPMPRFGRLSDPFVQLDLSVCRRCMRAVKRLNASEPVTAIVDSTGLHLSQAGARGAKGNTVNRRPVCPAA